MPTYTMSINLFPLYMYHEIEIMFNRYWWKGTSLVYVGIHWMRWNRLCATKKMGGLGFRQIHNFNITQLGKQGWCLLSNPYSLLVRVLKGKYYDKENSFLTAKLRPNASFTWCSIMASQDFLKTHLRIRIGNDLNTSIWQSPWLPHPSQWYIETILRITNANMHPTYMITKKQENRN